MSAALHRGRLSLVGGTLGTGPAAHFHSVFPCECILEEDDHKSLLPRLDERVGQVRKDLDNHRTETRDEFKKYITRTEFTPVKLIAFGIAGLILSSVLLAMLAFVLKR